MREAPQESHGRLSTAQMRLIDELLDRPGTLPGVAELAGLCGISTRHFFRMFRATNGVTLSDHAAAKRIDRARALLATPRPAIKEIAWHCGFETAAAFSAAFRRAVGVTPKEYRRTILH
jgi:AraC family transcriptional regulator